MHDDRYLRVGLAKRVAERDTTRRRVARLDSVQPYGQSQAKATQAASRRLPAMQAAEAALAEEGRTPARSSRRVCP